MEKIRSIFMGTPAVSVPLLDALNEISDIGLVVTQPDREVGRKRKMQSPPVKLRGEKLGLPVVQPERMKANPEFLARLKSLNPDVIVVVAFGRILPESILNLPTAGCVNVHYSLLPAYRGAAPVNWALVNGEKETGVTLMQMDKGLDTGPVIAVSPVEITLLDNAPRLFEKLTDVAVELLKTQLLPFVKGERVPIPQDEELASYAPMIQKSDGALDFSMPAIDVHNRIRGFQPWPGGFATANGRMFKFLETGLPEDSHDSLPTGTVTIRERGLFIVCGDNQMLPILRIQPENRKAMDIASCINGGYLKEGDRFESP
ncbi:MAG: methionyl-tRNA formyltransferase [Acidobacteria bacterium]|nr:MAG: methionyl-tRNA formyltransferase [Acidobacteriota bacterium]